MHVIARGTWTATVAAVGFWVGSHRELASTETPARPSVIPLTMSVSPPVVAAGTQATLTITLASPAPPGGMQVPVVSGTPQAANLGSAPNAILPIPMVPEGRTSITLPISTFAVSTRTAVTLRVSSGCDVATTTLTVEPFAITSVAIQPARVTGGTPVTATVTSSSPVPPGSGVPIQLSASLAGVTLPASVVIPPGSSSTTFSIPTTAVQTDRQITITASLGSGSSASGSLQLAAPIASAILLNPPTVLGGDQSTGTLVLTGPAPNGGKSFAMAVGGIGASVQPTVTIAAGADRQTFSITTQQVTTTTIVAINASPTTTQGVTIADGSSNTIQVGERPVAASANLTIGPRVTIASPPSVQSVTTSVSKVSSGTPVSVTVALQTPAPTGTTTAVQLSSNHPELVALPLAVTIPEGATTATVTAKTIPTSVDQTVTITASNSLRSVTTTLSVVKSVPTLAAFTIRPMTLVGGTNAIAELTLTLGPSANVVVSLTTDHPELISIPASVTLAPSTVPRAFTFRTVKPAVETRVTLKASAGTETTSVVLTITP
jgi:hypothetical protein